MHDVIDRADMSNGKILSQNFKTSKTFNWQVINLTVIVESYVTYLRVDTGCDKLFVNTRGDGLKQGMINKGNSCIYIMTHCR
jgi:hypothetical protein